MGSDGVFSSRGLDHKQLCVSLYGLLLRKISWVLKTKRPYLTHSVSVVT